MNQNYKKPFIIAEIGQAHDGSLGIAHSYIDALSDSGIDAIKWQTHIAQAESSLKEEFRVKFSYEDKNRFEYWKRMEFSFEQWKRLKKHSEDKGIEFIASPFSNAAVDLLEKLNVKRYKVGSGEINNLLMLKKIASTCKPIILSSGMSSFDELDESINFLKKITNNISILQCTTSYPTTPKDWGLNVINELQNKYDYPIGFSDHSGNIYACLAAAAKGASIFEFHVVFDKKMFGPDSKASLTINEVKKMVKGIKEINESLLNPIDKSDNSRFSDLKSIFEKSLAVNRNLNSGDIILEEYLEAKKPANEGIPAFDYKKIIGKKIKNNILAWDFLKKDNISE